MYLNEHIQNGKGLVMALRRSQWGWWAMYMKLNVPFKIFVHEWPFVLSKACLSRVTKWPLPA